MTYLYEALEKPTRLYIKQCPHCELKYFGKTVRENIGKYRGSGKRWLNHLNKHEIEPITLWISDWYYDTKITRFALKFSRINRITESDDWANLKEENGIDGGGDFHPEVIEKLRLGKLGELNPQYGKQSWNSGKNKDNDDRIKEYSFKQRKNVYNTNRPEMDEKTKLKLSEAAKRNGLGKIKTESHKNSLSIARKKEIQTDEGKRRLKGMTAKAADYHRGRPKEKIECPYCGKIGGKPAMVRFHFDNCREKNDG